MSALFKYAPPALSNLPLLHQGKTRDSFDIPVLRCNRKLRLPIATDRISTHNIVHKSTVPEKGEVLNFLSVFWFKYLLEPVGIGHHMVAWGKEIYDFLPGEKTDYPPDLHYRAMVVESLDMVLIEFIYRAYLTGSLWSDYYSKGLPNPYGIDLPPGLPLMAKFSPERGFRGPIFTPTKKLEGDVSDPPVNSKETAIHFPEATKMGYKVFDLTRRHLNRCELELVDSKFELGRDPNGNLKLSDEVVTPDSSRFVDLGAIQEGKNPPWRDKQIARDEAERIWGELGGGKHALSFSEISTLSLSETYKGILKQITGAALEEWRARADS